MTDHANRSPNITPRDGCFRFSEWEKTAFCLANSNRIHGKNEGKSSHPKDLGPPMVSGEFEPV